METNSLSDYLEQTSGRHLLFTGTFDPPHAGHVEIVDQAFEMVPSVASAIVIPHDWTLSKTPCLPLETRTRWVRETFDHFGKNSGRVVVLRDPVLKRDEVVDICLRFNGRVVRVLGSDSVKLIGIMERAGIPMIIHGRAPDGASSTFVRRSIRSGNHDQVGDIVAPSIRGEIAAGGFYR